MFPFSSMQVALIYDWILKKRRTTLKVAFVGAIIFIYFQYKKKKRNYLEEISSSENEQLEEPVELLNRAIYRNQILSQPDEQLEEPVEPSNLAFDGNQIPSQPDEQLEEPVEPSNLAFDGNQIPSQPDEQLEEPVEPSNLAFDGNQIPSQPDEQLEEPVEPSNLAIDGNQSPSQPDEKEQLEEPVEPTNLAFYKNQIPSQPDGDFIENILTEWKGDYYTLETCHTYIQWLFPTRIAGVNPHACTLQEVEAEKIRSTPELRERVRRAFEMMLDFYGMRLTSDGQFELAENSEKRLKELNIWGNHNFLRISRILSALKRLGHKDLMLPWMKFLADLIYKETVLDRAESSFEEFWIHTLDAEDKIEMEQYMNTMELYE